MPRTRRDSPPLPFERLRLFGAAPDSAHEDEARSRGHAMIAGVDEAGRGPLAGPVVAAAVILDPVRVPAGLDDSKALSPRRRDLLFETILASALAVSVASVSAERIDATNILAATMDAMSGALRGLAPAADHALIDGNRLPQDLPCSATALIGGDGLSVSIAAASIVAKVMRDRMMRCAGDAHPAYGFAAHKGYGSSRHHVEAIAAQGGVSRLHRFSFAPLK
jgi:ribonuclease HII